MRTASVPPFRAWILCTLLLWATGNAVSQDTTQVSAWKFLPETNRFRPLAANWQEARLGVRKQAGSSMMRLDIGASLEFLQFTPDSADGPALRLGLEFFAYGLSTSVEGLRLQIDALDGHFGGSVSLFCPTSWGTFSTRLRIMHLSSHFVDGHADDDWTSADGRSPIPFTRDFGELVVAPWISPGPWDLRPYLGVSYSTLVRPDDLARWGGVGGAEVFYRGFPERLFGRPSALYLAFHSALEGNPDLGLSTAVEAGLHMGGREGAAVRVFAAYFSGNDIFHQYYDLYRRYWTIGVTFEVR
jgi:hypothetical protein